MRGAFNSVFARRAHDIESAMAHGCTSGAGNNPSYADDHRRSRQDPCRRLRPARSRTGPTPQGVDRRPRDGASCVVGRVSREGCAGVRAGSGGRRRRGDPDRGTGGPERHRAEGDGAVIGVRPGCGGRCGCPDRSGGDQGAVERRFPASRHRRAGSTPFRADTLGNRPSTLRRDCRAEPFSEESAHRPPDAVTSCGGSAHTRDTPRPLGAECRIRTAGRKRSSASKAPAM